MSTSFLQDLFFAPVFMVVVLAELMDDAAHEPDEASASPELLQQLP